MKRLYPSYINTTIDAVFKDLSKKNKELINKFLEYCKITASENSIKKIYGKIVQIADIINKDLDTIDLEDVRGFLVLLNQSDRAIETQNDTKKVLKRFIKWKFENWSKKFKELKEVRLKDGMNHDKLNASTILTQDELDMIIKSIESLKYKTLILLMFELAGRPEEILKLKWKDVNLDTGEVKLSSSKLGGKTRINPINQSIEHLKRYKDECFYPTAKADDYVFPSVFDKEKSMSIQALSDFMNKTEKKIGLHKHLFPYILRHTRLTQLIKQLSPKVYEEVSGHSLEMGMKTYAHLNNDDVKKEMNEKIFKIEKLTRKEQQKIEELENHIKERESEYKKKLEEIEKKIDEIVREKQTATIKARNRK